VLNDEPTLRDLHDKSTLPDPRHHKPGSPPIWPAAALRQTSPAGQGRSPRGCVVTTALVASAALLLSLLSLLSVVNHSGLVSVGRFAAQFSPPSFPSVSTSVPAASPTPASSWLQVAPTSVQFGCADGQRTQMAVLENLGPAPMHWQTSFSVPTDQAGVDVSPNAGDLAPGASTVIQLQDVAHFSGQPVVIRFTPTDPAAGSPPSLSFTLVGCS
jgi:hypothetical protein